MGIHPINKLNFRDILKSPSYLVMLNIMLIVPLNSMLQILKTNTGLMEFIVVYVFLMLNVSIYFFLNMLTISLIVISEKARGAVNITWPTKWMFAGLPAYTAAPPIV